MSEIRNRFDNSKNEETSDKGLINESDISVADLYNTVDKINEDLNTLIAASDERNKELERLKDMNKSMYLSDNEESESEHDSEKVVDEHTESDSSQESESNNDESSNDSDEVESHVCDDSASASASASVTGTPYYSKIIFVPVKHQKDDGIPGLIVGVASLLILAWTMRALCIICAIGTNTCPNRV